MQPSRPAKARVKARAIAQRRKIPTTLLAFPLFLIALFWMATALFAEEKIIKSHAYAILGEPKYAADFEHFDYVNPDAPKGGEMSTWTQGTFDSFNPYSLKGRAGALSSASIERLMMSPADESGVRYGLLAESLEYPESRDWVIFNMRPEARFSDGTPVTADDIVFSHELLMEQALPSYREAISKLVQKVEAIDTHRVKFTFMPDVPRDGLISQVSTNPAFSRKWFEENNMRLDESRLVQNLGSGPYVLDTFNVNRNIVYRRNPDYWGKDLPVNRGRHNFDKIRIEYFTDNNAALEAFKGGVYAFRLEQSALTWATQYDFPAVQNGRVIKEEIADGNLPISEGFVFNLNRENLKDPRVREAISLMYNFEWTNESLQFGLYSQRHSFWENTDFAATGIPEGAELAFLRSLGDLIDPAILTEPAVMAHTSGARQLDRRNLRRATQLLQDSGWEIGDDGKLRNGDGQAFNLEFLTDDPEIERLASGFVDNLNGLGMNARLTRVDPTQYTNRTRARPREYDMIFDQYGTSLVPGLGYQQQYGSEDAYVSNFNPAGFADPGADAIIEKLIASKTPEEFAVTTKALDRVMRAERFIIPTWYKSNHWVAYYDQYEYPENMPPYALGYLDFWWYNADKGQALTDAGAFQ
ncbi:extracellular solute-binding protein [Parasulfitobacter algicola]|uniref:ABC transporter substrate-binding protein n=1 Tax=Parasulfitobacter algicola TaxID=2614809 RepID=A0ABX2IVK4_9RHOB|nr:extracellular solute-binding protein [Sulfitobacter algicola]NSX56535.1 ABC transporter substrate-binding protein [Sulfitobacter algicola]